MARHTGRTAPRIKENLEGRRGLLSDERVADWHDQMAMAGRNRLSAISNVRKLGFLLERLGLSVDEVETLAKRNPGEFRRRLNRYATAATEQGRTSNYLVRIFASLRAYLKFRDVTIDPRFFPKLENVTGASIANEKVPSQEQLGVVLDRLSTRGKVVALLMAHAGVRPQTIGMYEATDGLVLGDLPELELDPEPHFARVPFVINGRASLAKRRKSWTTFGSQQLATSVVAYLRERKDSGEQLGPNSPLVTAKETRGIAAVRREEARSKRGFITTTRIVFEVGNVLHATAPAGVRWRPYVLRAYFSTGLLRASVDRELREAMMSHDTGVPGAYTVGKPWGDALIEKARSEYERASEYLETLARPKSDAKAELLSTLATAIENATGKKAEGSLRGEDLVKALRDALAGASGEPSVAAKPSAPCIPSPTRANEQRAVDAELVGSYLEVGWEFKSTLNGHLAVVTWPGAV